MSERQIKTTQKSGGKTQQQLNQPVWSDGERWEKKKKRRAQLPCRRLRAWPVLLRCVAVQLPAPFLTHFPRRSERGRRERRRRLERRRREGAALVR